MEVPNYLCSLDGENSAIAFCLCSPEPVLLCENCKPEHCLVRNFFHRFYDIKAFPNKDIPGYLEGVIKRVSELADARKIIIARPPTIDRCIQELRDKVEVAIQTLRQFLADEIAKLEKLKHDFDSDIEASIAEAEAKCFELIPIVITKYAGVFWQPENSLSREAKFEYLIRVKEDFASTVIKLIYTSGDKPWPLLPQVCMKQLKLFDMIKKTTTIYSLPISFVDGTVYCLTSSKHLMCVSGHSPTKVAKMIDLETSNVRNLHDMNAPRLRPGIIKHRNTVYVFGGGNNTCETFSIASETWSNLPNMKTEKSYFYPCAYKDKIFLPEFRQPHKEIEFFDVISGVFGVGALNGDPSECLGASVSFIVDSTMYVITSNAQILNISLLNGVVHKSGQV